MDDASPAQRLLLYGDQMDSMIACIRNLALQSKKSVLLTNFLQGCCDSLKVELAALGDAVGKVPPFNSILDYAEQHAKTDGSSLLASAVLCYIGRIGELIIYSENDPSILTDDITIIGLCLGMLPAAVGSGATNTVDLVNLALDFVPAAVRIALCSYRRVREIEDTEVPGSWSYVVRDLPDDEFNVILDEFHQANNIPKHRRAYLSVLGPGWSSLSGPPSTLNKLIPWSEALKDRSLIPMPVRGLGHAPHLQPIDVEYILGDIPTLSREIPSRIKIVSTSTCERYEANTIGGVLEGALRDGFDRPLRLIDTVMATLVAMYGNGDIDMTCIGPTMQLRSLEKGMQQAGIVYKTTKKAELKDRSHARGGSGLIAIVGMAGRLPQSDNVAEFWDLILKGTDAHVTIPATHFPLEKFYDATNQKKNSTSAQHGCFLKDPGLFDTRLFNVSPREAMQMDPVQRLLLMTTHEALENAGFSPDSSPSTDSSRVAVYVGQCTEQWRDIAAVHGVDIFSVQGLLRAFTPGRLNYHFKFEGPSYSLDAACSSSSTSIALACSALLDRNCDMALAGGAQLSNTPLEFSGLSIAGFLSHTGNCKTFRADADGYCRGEGVGMVVLKRLEDAISDNDNIHAVISGWGRNHSANAISITHPHAATQERLYSQVLQQASLDPFDISYVEMHGTGTQAGDSIEMKSVTNVFAGPKRSNNPLYVGAVKANVGHSEAAAGVTAVIKASMMLQTGLVPPQVGADQPLNPQFPNLDEIHVRIPGKVATLKPSPASDGKKRILVNNFDAAGGNTCLVMEEAPAKAEKTADERLWHVVTVSGRTQPALNGNKQRLLEYLLTHQDVKLADVAYSTTARRMHEVWRTTLVGNSVQQIIKSLQDSLQKQETLRRSSPKANAVFVFTGQGSQYAGMGHELYRTVGRFASKIDNLQSLATYLGLPKFSDIITDPSISLEGRSTVDVQLATVSLEVALADLWKSWGVRPSAVLGHSLGEYAALCVAGVLSESDLLFLVGKRALLIQDKVTTGEYAMLSVAATIDEVQKCLVAGGYGSFCQVACYNAPESIVLSGRVGKLRELDEMLRAQGIRAKLLEVPYGFHSAQIDPILEEYEKIAQAAVFSAPSIPVLSTLTAEVVKESGVFNATYLMQQARRPVRFDHALRALKAANLATENTVYIESGPHAVCTSFVKASLGVPKESLAPTLRSGETPYKTIANSLANAYLVGLPVNWAEFHREHHGSLSLLALPTYAFDTREFWDVYQYDTMPGLGSTGVKAIEAPAKPAFSTTGLQRIVSQEVKGDEITITFESDTADEKLHKAIHGHIVNGAALCPTSVFSDMASGAAKYIWGLSSPEKPTPLGALADLDIFNALVVPTDAGDQKIRVTASASAKHGDISVTFSSRTGKANFIDNGKCVVKAIDTAKSKSQWSRLTPLVKARIDALMDPNNEDVVRLQRRFIYKLFNAVVKYDEKYHGIHALHMDEDQQDAVGIIRLRSLEGTGKWSISPYWSDTIVHLAGFVMNGSSKNPEDMAHISGGLDCMSLADELTDQKEYYSYVRMRDGEKKGASIGDVYILDGNEIIGYCEGVKFQQMKKSILNIVLGISSPEAGVAPAHATHATPVSHAPQTNGAAPAAKVTIAAPAGGDDDAQGDDVIDALIAAILSETGFDPAELDDSTALLDMGVDSLMSIAILDAVKRNTGIMLPVSFFMDVTTIGDINSKRVSSSSSSGSGSASDSEDASSSSSVNVHTSATTPFETYIEPAFDLNKYSSKPVLIQGSETSSKTPLFLICDGAGSASAYMYIPKLPSGTPVYALESPFLRNPYDFTCSCEEVATLYKKAMETIQPKGPYMIGGWSAGAVFAYEASRQLLVEGEEVQGLLLIDMKVPRRNLSVTAPTLDIVNQANLVTRVHGERQTFEELTALVKQHLLGSSLCVRKYEPTPMPEDRRPTNGTFIIWARSGLCDTMRNPDEVEEVSRDLSIDPIGKNVMYDNDIDMRTFLFSKRYHFGINGWDSLVGDAEAVVIEGDHFSIVRKPHVAALGQSIQAALDKFNAPIVTQAA